MSDTFYLYILFLYCNWKNCFPKTMAQVIKTVYQMLHKLNVSRTTSLITRYCVKIKCNSGRTQKLNEVRTNCATKSKETEGKASLEYTGDNHVSTTYNSKHVVGSCFRTLTYYLSSVHMFLSAEPSSPSLLLGTRSTS